MRRLLLGVPLIVGLGVSATHATAETISEGMNSPTFGVFSQGSLGGGPWSGEIQSQGMMMSNGIIYSQGIEIPDFRVKARRSPLTLVMSRRRMVIPLTP